MKKEIICGIYMITSPSGKIYIGQAMDVYYRWNTYNRLKCKQQCKLYSSFQSHGVENHKFEIVEICIQEKLNELEIHYIKFYDTFNTLHGLNLTSGGDGCKMSEETKKKISDHHKNDENYGMKGKKHSEETKNKQRESKLGENNHRFGKKQSPEVIEKRFRNMKKRVGFRHTEETKAIIREKRKLQIHPMLGRKYSKEHIAKIVETRRRNGSYKRTEEEKRKISIAHMGKKLSDITKHKISLRFKGIKLSEDHKQALRDGHARRKKRLLLAA